MCAVEGQYKQEDRHATDFQVFAHSQKLLRRGEKEKITSVSRSFFLPIWSKWGLLLQSVIHSDVQKPLPLCFAAWKKDIQQNHKLRIFGFVSFKYYLFWATLTASILHAE